jgi:two-component system chemotaxis response regulator CheY
MFCSSLVDVDKIREALDGGADDYIMKPFDEEIIITKLEILGLI